MNLLVHAFAYMHLHSLANCQLQPEVTHTHPHTPTPTRARTRTHTQVAGGKIEVAELSGVGSIQPQLLLKMEGMVWRAAVQ